MDTIININWIELSDTFQKFIIIKLLDSFNKKSCDEIIYYIIDRFTKKSCKLCLYYNNLQLKGVCVYWTTYKFFYLDKFFTLTKKSGYGIKMLDYFIKYHGDKNENINVIENKLIWRTDPLTSKFYLKNSDVIKHFEVENSSGDKKVYLGTKNKKHNWEYEDIYDITIKSCFT